MQFYPVSKLLMFVYNKIEELSQKNHWKYRPVGNLRFNPDIFAKKCSIIEKLIYCHKGIISYSNERWKLGPVDIIVYILFNSQENSYCYRSLALPLLGVDKVKVQQPGSYCDRSSR